MERKNGALPSSFSRYGALKTKKSLIYPLHISLFFSILGGKLDNSPVPVDGFDVWNTISLGKPSPRTEILLNIDLAPEEERYNDVVSDDLFYQGAAIRVGDMKLLMSCPNSTWFKPPELGDISTKNTVSEIIEV